MAPQIMHVYNIAKPTLLVFIGNAIIVLDIQCTPIMLMIMLDSMRMLSLPGEPVCRTLTIRMCWCCDVQPAGVLVFAVCQSLYKITLGLGAY